MNGSLERLDKTVGGVASEDPMTHCLRLITPFVLLIWLASPAAADTGFLDRALTLDGVLYRYQVYVPRDYSPTRKWPLILFLHGAGEGGNDGLLQTDGGLGSALRRHPDRYPAVVVFPQSATTQRFAGAMADAVMKMLETTEKEFATDENRVYLTGLSRGGNGAWYVAYRHPSRFAALLVSCGWVSPRPFPGGDPRPDLDPVVPAHDGEPFAALGKKLQHVPVWVFHGDADNTVSVDESRQATSALKSLNAPVRYSELPGVGHNVWDTAYGSEEVAQWLFSQRRP
jgi:predicted peptidase